MMLVAAIIFVLFLICCGVNLLLLNLFCFVLNVIISPWSEKVLAEIKDSDGAENIEWRQILVIDKDGRTAAHTGAQNEAWGGPPRRL